MSGDFLDNAKRDRFFVQKQEHSPDSESGDEGILICVQLAKELHRNNARVKTEIATLTVCLKNGHDVEINHMHSNTAEATLRRASAEKSISSSRIKQAHLSDKVQASEQLG